MLGWDKQNLEIWALMLFNIISIKHFPLHTVAVDQVGVGGGLATPAASPSRPNRQSEDVALGEVSLHVRHMHGGKAADDASKRTW